MRDEEMVYNQTLRARELAKSREDAAKDPVTKEGHAAETLRAEEARHFAEGRLMGVLGRALTRHERETGFGKYGTGPVAEWPLPSHRWWLTNPAEPCEVCAPGEPSHEDPRVRVKRLLATFGKVARPHSEACECSQCLPPEEVFP